MNQLIISIGRFSMNIGIPKEIKRCEYRVAITPSGVRAFGSCGHKVYVEKGAGLGCNINDNDYINSGAVLVDSHEEVFEKADMIYKVKDLLPSEFELIKDGQILFSFLHLAADKDLTHALLSRGVTGVAFETVQLKDGSLPLLEPMSEIAGRLSAQQGAKYLEKSSGGRGILLGGVPGVARGHVVIIGGGRVGLNAARIAMGLGAYVHVMDIDRTKLTILDNLFGHCIETLYSSPDTIEQSIQIADVLIGAVLKPGASAPRIISKEHLGRMKKGSVIVDVAVDQGGCCETTHPTFHDDPVFIVDDIVHYCVSNIPGAVPLTSTLALANVTLPYALKIANLGLMEAMKDYAIRKGINVHQGALIHPDVAYSLNMPYSDTCNG
jgi:alanine dehydrogenase